ncbi:MAG: rhomboid family intramembrane serine protease, partial [Anaerolineales bacterium]
MFAQLLHWVNLLLSIVFFFPTKDSRPRVRSFPWMTVLIVALNVLVTVAIAYVLPYAVSSVEAQARIVTPFIMVPADIVAGEGLGAVTAITAAFLHAGWDHLLGNMFLLVFFGRALEDILGPVKLGLFYLTCILGSALLSIVGRVALPLEQGTVPILGASGAVMGLVAGYLFLFFEERIRTLPMFMGVIPVPISLWMPAWAFFVPIALRDLISAYLEQYVQEYGFTYSATAVFAH